MDLTVADNRGLTPLEHRHTRAMTRRAAALDDVEPEPFTYRAAKVTPGGAVPERLSFGSGSRWGGGPGDGPLTRAVTRRAGAVERHLEQRHLPFARLHIEHVGARKHGGDDSVTNLALACDRCNAAKGTNLSGVDPRSGDVVELFHPRRDIWEAHVALRGARVVGLTPTGRATVAVLNMNEEPRIRLRETLIALGERRETDPK